MTAIDDLLTTIDKTYGKNTIMRASQAKACEVDRIPLGIPQLDLGIGGGIPRGRIVLVKGEYSTGKSLLAMKAVKQFQRYCRMCGKLREKVDMFTGEMGKKECKCKNSTPMQTTWLDLEGVFDNAWALKQGIKLEHVYLIRPNYAEQGIDVGDLVIRSGECDLIIVDSVAAMTPSKEVEDSTESWQMGLAARLVNKAMRKWTSGLNCGGLDSISGKPAIILINQVRVNLGVMYGSKTTTPGGKGQDFHSSIIIRMARKGLIKKKSGKKEDQIVGQSMGFDVPKNKVSPPHRSGVFDFYFSDVPAYGFKAGDVDMGEQWFSLGLKHGLITQNGTYFKMGEDTLGQGKDRAVAGLLEKPDVCRQIWEKACLEEVGYVF